MVMSLNNAWLKNLRFKNMDFGIYAIALYSSTISDIEFYSDNAPDPVDHVQGQYGISLWSGTYNHVCNVRYNKCTFMHDASVTNAAIATTFTSISGKYLDMDHHRGAPYATLWEDIDVGAGNRAFTSSGNAVYGPHSGAYGTFYNIWTRQRKVFFPKGQDCFGPLINFFGVDFQNPPPYSMTYKPYNWYFELNNTVVTPWRIRHCMLARRAPLSGKGEHPHEIRPERADFILKTMVF
jgi:hypothetical protein